MTRSLGDSMSIYGESRLGQSCQCWPRVILVCDVDNKQVFGVISVIWGIFLLQKIGKGHSNRGKVAREHILFNVKGVVHNLKMTLKYMVRHQCTMSTWESSMCLIKYVRKDLNMWGEHTCGTIGGNSNLWTGWEIIFQGVGEMNNC